MNFFTKMLIKKQLHGMPEAEVEKLITLIDKNPEFFKKMIEGVQQKTKNGMSQMDAAKQFAEENKEEMKKILGV